MSVQALGWAFDHLNAKGADRLVLLAIANHADKNPADGAWEAWPGIATIQREAGLERERTVNDALSRLVAKGLLERIINGAPDNRIRMDRRPNLYRIPIASGVPCGDTRCGWCRPERDDVSQHDGMTRDDATGCRETSPKPPVEPSEEPNTLATIVADDGFESRFWPAWPDKRNKGQARREWAKAVRKAGSVDVIVAGAQRFAADPNLPPIGSHYMPHASTWLSGERWNDPPLPSRTGRTTPQQFEQAAQRAQARRDAGMPNLFASPPAIAAAD